MSWVPLVFLEVGSQFEAQAKAPSVCRAHVLKNLFQLLLGWTCSPVVFFYLREGGGLAFPHIISGDGHEPARFR